MIMKSVESKMKIHLSDGRITNAIVLDDSFVLIDASKLSLNDEFMQYEPTSNNQRKFKKLLTGAINSGLSDFWRPKLDPSFNEERNGLVFEVGRRPAVRKSYNWWEGKARQYMPERGSRLGTRVEYVAFLGVLIKNLIASGWSVSKAWKAVCDDSRALGHYCNSENPEYELEPTGSRKVCGFCDLANTYKILAWDKKAVGFWLAGGDCDYSSNNYPLADLCRVANPGSDYYDSVGWLVLSK